MYTSFSISCFSFVLIISFKHGLIYQKNKKILTYNVKNCVFIIQIIENKQGALDFVLKDKTYQSILLEENVDLSGFVPINLVVTCPRLLIKTVGICNMTIGTI